MTRPRVRRADTRDRIEATALRLFVERGYEKTSLREIGEELDVTKAAVYYHFRSKEDIVVSLLRGLGDELDALVASAKSQPASLATRRELLRRFDAVLAGRADLLEFLQANQATLGELRSGQDMRERVTTLTHLMVDPAAPLANRVRAISAMFTVYFGTYALGHLTGTDEQKRAALLEVALEQLDAAHGHRP